MEWRTIDSAPKDGAAVLVYVPEARTQTVGNIAVGAQRPMANGETMWIIGGHFAFDVGQPTHWMPLPNPPATEA